MPTQGDGAIPTPKLHLITPPGIDETVLRVTTDALAAGAPLVQVRTKDPSDRVRLHHAGLVREACSATGSVCLVNDRVDLAQAVGADGVHLGDDDLPVEVARRILGEAAVIGATCRDPDAARRAVDAGASYLGVGPAYATTTKAGLPDPLGPAGIEAVAAAVDVPVIAIAGVTVDRVAELLDAGARGVAVVGAVYSAPDPAAAVAAFLVALGDRP
jgi:thiamine-phosphate pyrophosphorylase